MATNTEENASSRRRFLKQASVAAAAPAAAALLAGARPGTASAATFSADDGTLFAPELVLVNGEVLTMDDNLSSARALAISGGRIVAVGSNADVRALANAQTRVVDVEGRTVIPGLIDAHNHNIRGGLTHSRETYWLDSTSLSDALALLTQAAKQRAASDWVAVVGSWDPNQFTERRAPTVAELTAASPTNPAYVQYLYTYALLNESGIRALGLNESTAPPVPGLQVERDSSGKATGRLLGNVGSSIGPFNQLVAKILLGTPQVQQASLAGYLAEIASCGVTGSIDASAGPEAAYPVFFAVRDQGQLPLRAGFRVPAQAEGAEASFYESLMAFRAPWESGGLTPFMGMGEFLNYGTFDETRLSPGFEAPASSLADLEAIATLAATLQVPVEAHAYTDDAASQILDIFEKVNQAYPIGNLRWSIAHLTTGTVATVKRMKALGMALGVQMTGYYAAPTILAEDGAAVADRQIARIALDEGVLVAGGTDSTRGGDYRVWPALQYQITGASAGNVIVRSPDQRLTRMETLKMYTISAAWLAFADTDRGSLEPGKLADLAVLDRPYLQVPATQIGQIRSVLTLLGGSPVYDKFGWIPS
jgi:predicted amidohydrolase YtcJ